MSTTGVLPQLPAIVDGVVAHRRTGPVRHSFVHRAYQWLVDLDQLPLWPWYLRAFARFDARDHLGGTGADSSATIKTNVERYLQLHGVSLGKHSRIVMLANARVFGYVFDPLTVFWCFDDGGELRCIIAEVHNTYGQRHAYLLTPDADGRAAVEKGFYVSPFNDVTGRYTMRFRLSDRHVSVAVALDREGVRIFRAVFSGAPLAATRRSLISRVMVMPFMSQQVSALIRWHGIRLWIRRLPIVRRPPHPVQDGVG